MVTVEVLTGPPGSGKSTQMMQDMAENPGRYLWAAPITDLIDEQVPRLRELAPHADVLALHSRAKLTGSVGRNISDLPRDYSDDRHVAAFITHEGLLGANAEAFGGWHVRIDETPNAISAGILKIPHSVDLLKANYRLEPMEGSEWSQVVPFDRRKNWSHLTQDDIAKSLANFHSLARGSSGVIVEINDWDQARDRNGVEWLSIWTPKALNACASVTLTGAGYFNSLAYRVVEASAPGEIQHIRTPAKNSMRTGQPRVRIHFFTQAHRGTTTLWSKSEGRACLVPVCDWLVEHVPELGFWSGNDVVQILLEHRVCGQMVKPKLAGLNSLRDHRCCAFIYSSKAVAADKPLKRIFNLTDADILAGRETEDILQFVFRGAIRNPAYDGPYDIYLYHLDQANAVATKMEEYGFFDVDIVPILDSPIMDTTMERRPAVTSHHAGKTLELKRKQARDRKRRSREKAAKEKLVLQQAAKSGAGKPAN